jgi:hypothetical protein
MEIALISGKGCPMLATPVLGYDFHPRLYLYAPGCSRLDVALRGKPTHLHFDPEKLHLHGATPAGDVVAMTFGCPWNHDPQTIHVCAGRISLEDRVEKRVEFLTLGGTLAVRSAGDVTLCTVTSPAPMIELSLTRGLEELLAEELEEILARRRAYWERQPGEFERRLAGAEPLTLYAACLIAMTAMFEHRPHGFLDDPSQELIHFLGIEMKSLEAGGLHAAALEDIL